MARRVLVLCVSVSYILKCISLRELPEKQIEVFENSVMALKVLVLKSLPLSVNCISHILKCTRPWPVADGIVV